VNARDPFNALGHFSVAGDYLSAGRLDEAIESIRIGLRLAPEWFGGKSALASALLLNGDAQAALKEQQQEPHETLRLSGLAVIYHTLGRRADSDAALAKTIKEHGSELDGAINIAYVLAWRNERDRAFEWLDKAVTRQDPALRGMAASDPFFANLHDDPRWLPFLRKIGRAPEQLAAVKFDVKLPQ
jgi:tetratricopeptide (TPR) repeat protein